MKLLENTLTLTEDRDLYYRHTEPNTKTDKVIIVIHGLVSSSSEALYYNSSLYLCDKNFATIVPSLYEWRDTARSLDETCLDVHKEDIKKLVSYLSKKYESIYVVGHSIGGVVALLLAIENFSNNIKAISLWEPTSFNYLRAIKDRMIFNKATSNYIYTGGAIPIQFSRKYADSIVNAEKTIRFNISKIDIPVQIIVAGDGVLLDGCSEYFSMLDTYHKDLKVVTGATHFFNEHKKAIQVYSETIKFFNYTKNY